VRISLSIVAVMTEQCVGAANTAVTAEIGDMGNESSPILFVVLAMLCASVSFVCISYWKHTTFALLGNHNRDYATHGIWTLLCIAGGISYLFYNSVYAQVGDAAQTIDLIMKMSPIVYSLFFLAAAIPAIEVYLQPRRARE